MKVKDLLETWVKKGDVLILQIPGLEYDEAIAVRDEVGRVFATREIPVVILSERVKVDFGVAIRTKEELEKKIDILIGLAQVGGVSPEEIDGVLELLGPWKKET